MWFQRKAKNRAFERRHVLDVKVARREKQRLRVRVATLAASLSLGTVFAVYVAWRCGEWALNHFVYENRAFSVEQIDIQTDGVFAPEQLRRWAGVKRNDNLFAVDLTRVKRDLELIPAIQNVAVERVLPRTLRIIVTEREPIAALQNYLVDADGYAMMPVDILQRAVPPQPGEHYPLIIGMNPNGVRAGKQIELPQVRAALQFIAAFDRSAMATVVDIMKVDVSQPEVLLVTTTQQNEITFRTTEFEKQLNRWWLVHQAGVPAAKQIASLDLSVPEHVPLKWQDAPVMPPNMLKIRKTSPYKKKHV